MNVIKFLSSNHCDRLPTVRVSHIKIVNVKDVKSGTIDFACSKYFVEEGTQSDILGIYGQNGSGKTTLIQVLEIIKRLLSGKRMSPHVIDLITVGAETSLIEIHFDFQYPNGDIRDISYSFEIGKQPITDDIKKTIKRFDKSPFKNYEFVTLVFNEKVGCSGVFNGKKLKKQPLIEVDANGVYSPTTKVDTFFDDYKNINERSLDFIFKKSKLESRSAIFSDTFFSKLKENTDGNDFAEIIKELRLFAEDFLFVSTSEANTPVRGNFCLPFFSEKGVFYFNTDEPTIVTADFFDEIQNEVAQISSVLCKWVPGLELALINVTKTETKEIKDAISFELASKRGDSILPIRYEADGVRKIIMYLKLLICAFNQKSTTVAIDELDAGVFEFLLGEILELFERHGKGQLIFTSHNLRPLEVLDKKFLCFTTSNPENRFVRMKSVGHTNNLRLLYLKEIMLGGTQDEQLYKKEKEYAILGAIKKCKVFE